MSELVPFIEIEEWMRIGFEICSKRNDSTVSGDEFARLLARFAEACRLQGFQVGAAVSREVPTPPPIRDDRADPMREDEKKALRKSYREMKETRGRNVPWGFVKQLAAKYRISVNHAYSIIYSDPLLDRRGKNQCTKTLSASTTEIAPTDSPPPG